MIADMLIIKKDIYICKQIKNMWLIFYEKVEKLIHTKSTFDSMIINLNMETIIDSNQTIEERDMMGYEEKLQSNDIEFIQSFYNHHNNPFTHYEDSMPTNKECDMMSYEEKLQSNEPGFMQSFRNHHNINNSHIFYESPTPIEKNER